jgi:hypothetical protein
VTEALRVRNGRGYLLDDIEAVDARESGHESDDQPTSTAPPAQETSDPASSTPPERPELSPLLGTVTGAAVVLCLAVALIHVVVVFLHVAPTNPVSQRYSPQINGWIYPVFEQNWRLFAPNPESVNRQILARTSHTAPDGTQQISDWFDLTAVDQSAVEHDFFPSHTAQNMLRRAWSLYSDFHGNTDRSSSERALMMQKYLRNIAVDRLAEHRHSTFEAIQLRVITRPIAAPSAEGSADSRVLPPTETRDLPWWKTGTDEN